MNQTKEEYLDCIMREQTQLESKRGTFESHWQEIGDRIYPSAATFNRKQAEGAKNTQYIFDSTAALALERFASAVNGYVTPSNQKWHGIETDNEELNKDPEIRQWCELVTEVLFSVRYSDMARFESQMNEVYMSLGAFGTGCLFVDDRPGKGIIYKSIHLSQIFFSENEDGIIDRNNRKYKETYRNVVKLWGDTNELSEKVKTAAINTPNEEMDVLHCVRPNEKHKPGAWGHEGMPFSSTYILPTEKMIVEEGGYRSFPYAISRYITQTEETYGRSPAMTVLPDVKTLNEVQKTFIRAAQMNAEPPVLLQEDGALSGFKMKPAALNYGGVDEQGRPLAHAFNPGSRPDMAMELQDQKRKHINDAFLITLFQILVDNPTMTAYEVMQRMQEKGQLLGPTMGRQRTETQSVVIAREIDILEMARALPPRPQKLLKAGARIRIRSAGPMARAQRAEEGVGILRTIQSMAGVAEIDKDALLLFRGKGAKIGRALGEINGMPEGLMNTDDEIAALKEGQKQADQANQLIQAAPVAASAAKDLAQANAVAANGPNSQFPSLTIQ